MWLNWRTEQWFSTSFERGDFLLFFPPVRTLWRHIWKGSTVSLPARSFDHCCPQPPPTNTPKQACGYAYIPDGRCPQGWPWLLQPEGRWCLTPGSGSASCAPGNPANEVGQNEPHASATRGKRDTDSAPMWAVFSIVTQEFVNGHISW